MDLLTAYKIRRAAGVPDYVISGYVAPIYRGESYASPNDGIGAAAYALKMARADVLAWRNAKAHFEDMAAAYDADKTPERAALKETARATMRKAEKWQKTPPSFGWIEGKPGHAYCDKPEAFGLRLVGRVMPEASSRNGIWDTAESCGWHSDPFGDVFRDGTGLVYGLVYQLPGRKGRARFVAAYEHGGIDGGPEFDFSDIREVDARNHWSDASGAAVDTGIHHAADDMAKHAAEKEREYQTAWQCGNQYAEAAAEIAATRKAALQLLAERRAARGTGQFPGICAAIRDKVESAVESIAEARATMAQLIEGNLCEKHGLGVYMDSDAKAAFCEAAGLDAFPA